MKSSIESKRKSKILSTCFITLIKVNLQSDSSYYHEMSGVLSHSLDSGRVIRVDNPTVVNSSAFAWNFWL